MKLIVDVKDEKVPFVLELLNNLKFVKTEEVKENKSGILENIKEAVEEMKLIKTGKSKARDAQEFIDELQG